MQAPDGAIWKIATSAKKDTGPATREIDDVVLLLGVDDVKATKAVLRRATDSVVAKSFGGKYVEFEATGSAVKLALYTAVRGEGRGRRPRGQRLAPARDRQRRRPVRRPGRVRLERALG